MITAIVSAIGNPISSVVSGWFGGSGMWRLWRWNLVLTQVGMLDNDVSWELPSKGQVMKLGPTICAGWVERDWGCGSRCWA